MGIASSDPSTIVYVTLKECGMKLLLINLMTPVIIWNSILYKVKLQEDSGL